MASSSSLQLTSPRRSADHGEHPLLNFPIELLREVMLFTTHVDAMNPHDPLATIIASSQVSRLWRQLVLGSPDLWAAVLTLNREYSLSVGARIDRCGRFPIDSLIFPSPFYQYQHNEHLRATLKLFGAVHVPDILHDSCLASPHNDFQRAVLGRLPDLLPRIRRLTLQVPLEEWEEETPNRFFGHSDISHLTSLCVIRSPSTWPGVQLPDAKLNVSHELDEKIKSAQAPWGMRSLDLRGCSIHLGATAFAHLEDLTVASLPPALALAPQIWLTILNQFPLLKNLLLVGAIGDSTVSPHAALHRDTKVNLDHLQSLQLHGSHFDCFSILRTVLVPDNCDVFVTAVQAAPPLFSDGIVKTTLNSWFKRYQGLSTSINVHIQDESISIAGGSFHFTSVWPRECRNQVFEAEYGDDYGLIDDLLWALDEAKATRKIKVVRLKVDLAEISAAAMTLDNFWLCFRSADTLIIDGQGAFNFLLPYFGHPTKFEDHPEQLQTIHFSGINLGSTKEVLALLGGGIYPSPLGTMLNYKNFRKQSAVFGEKIVDLKFTYSECSRCGRPFS